MNLVQMSRSLSCSLSIAPPLVGPVSSPERGTEALAHGILKCKFDAAHRSEPRYRFSPGL